MNDLARKIYLWSFGVCVLSLVAAVWINGSTMDQYCDGYDCFDNYHTTFAIENITWRPIGFSAAISAVLNLFPVYRCLLGRYSGYDLFRGMYSIVFFVLLAAMAWHPTTYGDSGPDFTDFEVLFMLFAMFSYLPVLLVDAIIFMRWALSSTSEAEC